MKISVHSRERNLQGDVLLIRVCDDRRYIPVVLERLPQKINEKPPYYVGRNDLETLMASGNCADWVKIR